MEGSGGEGGIDDRDVEENECPLTETFSFDEILQLPIDHLTIQNLLHYPLREYESDCDL